MIPKIIHYVWIGNNPKPKKVQICIDTWRKKLKGYKIIEWNENNFDIHQNQYIERAYKAKKWAFVSDYIRAKVIYDYGGIYLDTDVNLLHDFDDFINNKCFVGFERAFLPFTAVFGAEAHHPFIKKMLSYYETHDFEIKENSGHPETNTDMVSRMLINEYNCKLNNQEQLLKDDIRIYPNYVLCVPSKKSVAIHVFTGSWTGNKKTLKRKIMTSARLHIKNNFEAELYNQFVSFFHRDILY
ncbi:glycosyltransferase family 32 protein [Limosilactobacillus reuteri]|uniref:glycosyltransferase family 32 protein n=1 Tax=Limosilactobacillus reuteri TaxID=1598 RepID=UPI002B0538FB|nr:glycosyltransferase [Limosilactobacillus reuteri]